MKLTWRQPRTTRSAVWTCWELLPSGWMVALNSLDVIWSKYCCCCWDVSALSVGRAGADGSAEGGVVCWTTIAGGAVAAWVMVGRLRDQRYPEESPGDPLPHPTRHCRIPRLPEPAPHSTRRYASDALTEIKR